jgi:hypothetical protein
MSKSPLSLIPALNLVVTIGLVLLTPVVEATDEDASDLDLLASWMAGTFSSAAQAAEDTEFFEVSLHMAPIWTDRTDGRWLYIEQAVSEHQDRPYRQRVYRLVELAPGLFESQIFTLPDPASVIGVWLTQDPLAELGPGDLEERDGCAILLRRRGENFIGSTLASLCTSTLRGAAYATSEVVVTPEGVVSWDRGFAADGSQVWGPTNGGYVFDRIVPDEEEPPPDPDPDSDSDSDSEQETEAQGEIKPETTSQPE